MSDKFKSNLWIEEEHPGGNFIMRYRIKESLFRGKSDFQQVEVVESESYGKMLFNDSLAMISEKDEFIYHDMITHVPMFTHPNPKKVLVIGGGDGGTAREVLRHPSVEKCVMVEIDKMVCDACYEHIPQTSSVFDNPKLELKYDDGVAFVKNTKELFDVVLVDSTDPIGPATPLFGEEFYADVFNCLTDDGIVVSQGESPFFNQDMQKKLLSILNNKFLVSSIYNFSNLTYPGGLWSFTFGSKKHHPVKDFNVNRVLESKLKFGYYNEQIHTAAFCLPEFMRNELKDYIR